MARKATIAELTPNQREAIIWLKEKGQMEYCTAKAVTQRALRRMHLVRWCETRGWVLTEKGEKEYENFS